MDSERFLIEEALREEKVTAILKAWYKLPAKVSKESIDARRKGNDLYVTRHHNAQVHEEIWKYYSLSIAKAPIASEDLALAYGNRSALLVHIGKFQESIGDIDRALEITQSSCLKVKLLCRKLQCFSALGIDDNIKNILDQAKDCLGNVEQKDKEFLIKTIDKANNFVENIITNSLLGKEFSEMAIESRMAGKIDDDETSQIKSNLKDRELVNPFEAVSLKYTEQYGRHLVANRHIKAGEIVNISRPYVTALNLNNFYAFCGHCLKTSWANIPCDYCSWCMFCSEKCKAEAWEKYHDFECQIIPYIQFNQTSDYWKQLSLKLTIVAMKEAGSIEKLKEELATIDSCKDELQKGFVNQKLQENSYKSIYSLTSNVSSSALQIHIDHAVLTLIILAKSTSFFGKNLRFSSSKDLLSNENVLFIGSLIFKFLKISDINAHCVMEGSSKCRFGNNLEKCESNRCCERGACIATVPSFLNHSCYPTVRKCFTEDMQLIVYALQPIKKNHQLFDCYVGSYFDKSYLERQTLLQEFNFKCECQPCKNEWPTILLLHNHSNYVRNSNIEASLLEKHQALIECKDGKVFNLKALRELSEDISKAKDILTEPSYAIAMLISTLWTVFDHIHGIRLKVTDKCINI